jgi:Fe2+ or Zn2+ uptake regulation protein
MGEAKGTTALAILELFADARRVMTASEIIADISHTGRGEESVRKALTQLVRSGRLHRVAFGQYASDPNATRRPTGRANRLRVAELEARMVELERRLAVCEACHG